LDELFLWDFGLDFEAVAFFEGSVVFYSAFALVCFRDKLDVVVV
jgi:hypothetical protein